VRLKEADDPGSPDLAVTLLQLATYYYANDMLQDAGPICQRAGVLMRGHFPEEHDLVGGWAGVVTWGPVRAAGGLAGGPTGRGADRVAGGVAGMWARRGAQGAAVELAGGGQGDGRLAGLP
jgi:hypothetical protein